MRIHSEKECAYLGASSQSGIPILSGHINRNLFQTLVLLDILCFFRRGSSPNPKVPGIVVGMRGKAACGRHLILLACLQPYFLCGHADRSVVLPIHFCSLPVK